MGFFKRFFSLGSKKSKKNRSSRRNAAEQVDASGRIVRQTSEPWQERETDANRLLRSSSAHFKVVKQVDYSTLPPLPHPINNVCTTPTPTPSTTPTPTPGLQRRGTYTVTVHERQLHSRTEFPNANPSLNPDSPTPIPFVDLRDFDDTPDRVRVDPKTVPFTPHDNTRAIRLRQDPSVVSLLNMYDDKGHIKSDAFTNSPQTPTPLQEIQGRDQKKCGGSTLRQLLGDPESTGPFRSSNMLEGDISWADRFLGEFAADDSAALDTNQSDNQNNQFKLTLNDISLVTDSFHTQDTSANLLSISSLEVEVSETNNHDMEELVESYGDTANQEKAIEPSTPQRPAAEVFQFIAERRKSLRERERMQEPERLYPYPVSRFSSCSSECTPHHTPDRLSAAPTIQTLNSSPGGLSDTSHAQIQTATLTRLTPIENPLSRSTDTLNLLRILTPTPTSMGGPNGPRPAPGSDFPPASQALTTPRVQDKTTEEIERYPAFLQCQPNIMTTNDPYTRVRPRRQYRCPSQPDDDVFSVHSSNDHHSEVGENDTVRIFVVPPKQQRKASNPQHPRRSSNLADKENTAVRRNERKPRISASKVFTPPTPPNSSRRPRPRRSSNARSRAQALLEVRQPNRGNGSVPSPASSSELSPVGKDMMANLRKQRQRSRDDMKVPPRSLRR